MKTEHTPRAAVETRYPIECDCGADPEVPVHIICSACGDDWDECICGAPDDEELWVR